jgi:hypothetical protein
MAPKYHVAVTWLVNHTRAEREGTAIHTIVDCGENSAVLGMHQFGDQERRSSMGDGNTKTDQKPRGQKHTVIDANALKNDAYDPSSTMSNRSANPCNDKHLHDDAADQYTHSSPQQISNIRHDRQSY